MNRSITLTGRILERKEVPDIWSIDRAEVIDAIYSRVNGVLELRSEHYDMAGWPVGEPEKYTPLLLECFDAGGWFYGMFDGEKLIGVAILENRWIGPAKDQLQLKFLHVSQAYRKQGLGKRLFTTAKDQARHKGAKKLYISATPSENTVNFYLGLGCVLVQQPDAELFELEPEDIHLECLV